MKTSTPILSVVKAMHAEDDAKQGYNPYDRGYRRPVDPVAPPTSQSEREAASRLLATYNSTLDIDMIGPRRGVTFYPASALVDLTRSNRT